MVRMTLFLGIVPLSTMALRFHQIPGPRGVYLSGKSPEEKVLVAHSFFFCRSRTPYVTHILFASCPHMRYPGGKSVRDPLQKEIHNLQDPTGHVWNPQAMSPRSFMGEGVVHAHDAKGLGAPHDPPSLLLMWFDRTNPDQTQNRPCRVHKTTPNLPISGMQQMQHSLSLSPPHLSKLHKSTELIRSLCLL